MLGVDAHDDGCGWGKFLSIKLDVDLTRALAREKTITMKGKRHWVPLKYEKFPRICFVCGKISHMAMDAL